jgi:hypothetical protein
LCFLKSSLERQASGSFNFVFYWTAFFIPESSISDFLLYRNLECDSRL